MILVFNELSADEPVAQFAKIHRLVLQRPPHPFDEDVVQTPPAAGARCSMDGRGRCLDNVFIERLWRSLKYEAVY